MIVINIKNSFCLIDLNGNPQNWYLYHLSDRLVYISMTSLLFGVFSIGLSIGVIIAVGGLLVIQVIPCILFTHLFMASIN
jgi:hypothetical protein